MSALKQYLKMLEQRLPAFVNFENTRDFAKAQCLDQLSAYIITVTGTNGKGSSVHALEKLCLAAGLKVAVCQSPHLVTPEDRLRINGRNVDGDLFLSALKFVEQHAGSRLGYYATLYLAQLKIIRNMALDVVILEVGVGGRHDVTNIFDADMLLITGVSLDHCEFLGNSIEAIAYEKAGLMRKDQLCVFAGNSCPRAIQSEAKKVGAKLLRVGIDFPSIACRSRCLSRDLIASLLCLFSETPFKLDRDQALSIMKDLQPPGRCHLLPTNPAILLDVAHNPESCERLAQFVSKRVHSSVIAITQFKGKKDALRSLFPFKDLIDEWLLIPPVHWSMTNVDNMTGVLRSLAQDYIREFADFADALRYAIEKTPSDGLIIVFGSFILVGEAIAELQRRRLWITKPSGDY